MKSLLLKGTILALGLSLCSSAAFAKPESAADAKADSSVSHGDRTWVSKVYNVGLEEIALGQLAQTKGSSQAVKDLGAHMISGHTELNKELKGLADKKGITISKSSYDSDYKKLNALSGPAFDKQYAKMMVDGHSGVVKDFKSEGKSNDPNLKAWADKNLAAIQGHLSMAQAVQAKVGK